MLRGKDSKEIKQLVKLVFCGFLLINAPWLLLHTSTQIEFVSFSNVLAEKKILSSSSSGWILFSFDKQVKCRFDGKQLDAVRSPVATINSLKLLGEVPPQMTGVLECEQNAFSNKPKLFRSVLALERKAVWRLEVYNLFVHLLIMFGLFSTLTLLVILSFVVKIPDHSLKIKYGVFFFFLTMYALYLTGSNVGFLEVEWAVALNAVLRTLYQAVVIYCVFEKRKHRLWVIVLHAASLIEHFFLKQEPFGTNTFYQLLSLRLLPISIFFFILAMNLKGPSVSRIFRAIFCLWFFLQLIAYASFMSPYFHHVFTHAFLVISSIYLGKLAIVNAIKTREDNVLAETKLLYSEKTNKSLLRMTHDLKSPLSGINLVAKNSHALPQELRNILFSASKRMHEIISNSLDYAKPNRVENITVLELAQIVEELASEYTGRVEVSKRFPPETLSRVFSFKSKPDLMRVLANLLQNSIEAQLGIPKVSFSFEVFERSISLIYQDDGPGLSSEVLAAIKAGRAITTKKTGTGIGLLSIQSLLEGCGGQLELCNTYPGVRIKLRFI